MAFATVDDLAVRFPRALTSAEEEAAEVMLDDASFLLSIEVPGLSAAVDGGNEDVTEAALLFTVAAVKRTMLAQAAQAAVNPALDQVAQTFGPYSSSIKYKNNGGNLYWYPNEIEALIALLGGESRQAISIRSPGF